MRELAAQFLALAEKQGATVPLMIGHRLMGASLLSTGDIAEGRAHFDRAIALYDPPSIVRWRRDLAMTSGWRSCAYRALRFGMLGYPDAALADAERALATRARSAMPPR